MIKQANAYQKFIRIAPRKMRLVAGMIRGKKADHALVQLQVANQAAAKTLRQVLVQAKANALQIGLKADTLVVKSLMIEEGPTFKRWNPVSRGRAHSILKRACHIKLTLEGSDQSVVKHTSEKKLESNTKTTDQKKGK